MKQRHTGGDTGYAVKKQWDYEGVNPCAAAAGNGGLPNFEDMKMTRSEYVAWLTGRWEHDMKVLRQAATEAKRRGMEFLYEQHIAQYNRISSELAMVNTVTEVLHYGYGLQPFMVIWNDWINDMVVTYQNNQRDNEAQNTIDRNAAREKRDAALAGRQAA